MNSYYHDDIIHNSFKYIMILLGLGYLKLQIHFDFVKISISLSNIIGKSDLNSLNSILDREKKVS